jgi:hypothetical protein
MSAAYLAKLNPQQRQAVVRGHGAPRSDGAERGRRADSSEGDSPLLTTWGEINLWMTAPAETALKLHAHWRMTPW